MYATPHAPSDPRQAAGQPWWLLIGPELAALIGLFQLTAIGGFSGLAMQRDLGLASHVMLLGGFGGYLIGAALLLPVGLLLGARLPTTVTTLASGLLLLGSLAVAFTPNAVLFLVGRVLDGLGAGAAIGAAIALILRLHRGRAAAAGVFAGLGVLMLVIAPFAGGLIAEVASFRLVYMISAVFALGTLTIAGVVGIVLLMSRKPPVQPMPYGQPMPGTGPGQPGAPFPGAGPDQPGAQFPGADPAQPN